MELQSIREQLYHRYIEPTKKETKKYIGVEIEIPIVNLTKEAVDFETVHTVTARFIERFGFTASGIDDEGNIYSAASPENGDILSYDCSYNNLELSFGKEKDLYAIQSRFADYYSFLQNQFKAYNYTLTGMGVNPYRKYNHNVPIPNGRYRMLFHHLHSYTRYKDLPMHFHSYPEYGTFSSASQVQLDVAFDKLLAPLYSRIEKQTNPAKKMLELLHSNTDLSDIILEYGKL